MNDKLISVIIPCYNAEKYIAQTLESVLAQQQKMQIIVVDDGSTDLSADIVQSFSKKIQYFRQENRGVSSARNTGIKLAKGEFIIFLDTDDLWPEGSLKKRLDILQTFPKIDYVYGKIEHFISPEMEDKISDVIPDIALGRLAGSCLFRSSSFLKVGYFDCELKIGEMIDWFAQAKQHNLTSEVLPEIVLKRRIHSNNSVKKETELRQSYLKALRTSIQKKNKK
ncbi:MAG: glycosyltransferase involved in cell wall biosynthesis [Thermoproteota archaeon]|jgi:glycosyltransferase involved in cell wall biosynthesis